MILNVIRRPDSQWRGLDPIEIYRAETLGSAIYRAELARARAKRQLLAKQDKTLHSNKKLAPPRIAAPAPQIDTSNAGESVPD
jgi:hypothetical protein